MYIPDIYKNENQTEIHAFIEQNGFGILVNLTNSRLWATHIPLQLEIKPDGKTILHGHISNENPQAEGFVQNDEVLAIFSGPHSYVSSSWYNHENVPTWNYIAVHVYGKVRILDEQEVIESLTKLVEKYEANSEKQLRVEEFSKKTMMQTRGIVGFEIEISDIHAKKKLSQNRDKINYEIVISKLENSNDYGAQQVATEMKKNNPF